MVDKADEINLLEVNLLSVIFMNQQMMFLTHKKSIQNKNLMIFDELLLQKKCEAYYVRGRHSNCDCLYESELL